MISTQRSAAFTFVLLLLCIAVPVLGGSVTTACTTGCPMSSPLFLTLQTGLSLFALILFSLKFVNTRLETPEGILLVLLLLFNPLMGFMGGGTIPPINLAGTAIAIGVLALTIRNDHAPQEDLLTGIVLVGVLIGIAPSFVPLVILPLLIAFGRSQRKGLAVLLFVAAIAVWLAPIIVRSGWNVWLHEAGNNLAAYVAGLNDAAYGFPGIEEKRVTFLQNLLIDGLGGYRTGGTAATIVVTLGLALGFARGAWWMFHRETDGLVITVACISIYIVWLIFNPNNIREARHVLPLLPLLLYPVWSGSVQLMQGGLRARAAALLFLGGYVVVGIGKAAGQ